MPCRKKDAKSQAAEATCCQRKPEESSAKIAEKSAKPGCGCHGSTDSTGKKEEAKESGCC
jgi:hypothetical protein